jgi:hypothetical protein
VGKGGYRVRLLSRLYAAGVVYLITELKAPHRLTGPPQERKQALRVGGVPRVPTLRLRNIKRKPEDKLVRKLRAGVIGSKEPKKARKVGRV